MTYNNGGTFTFSKVTQKIPFELGCKNFFLFQKTEIIFMKKHISICVDWKKS